MANGLAPVSALATLVIANAPANAAPTANATGLTSFLSVISISYLWLLMMSYVVTLIPD
jgi:hypothetical protein